MIQVNPQNIDQVLSSVEQQQSMIEERYNTLRDIKDALDKGDLLYAAKIWVSSQLTQITTDMKIVESNIAQLRDTKRKLNSGIVIPNGAMSIPNSVNIK